MPIGLYTLSEQIQAIGSNNWPSQAALNDSYFNYNTLLLHGNGTNSSQNNTFIDSSTNNFSATRNGNITQGSYSPYGGEWSIYLDGTGDYLSIPTNTALDLSTGDFTIECWVYWQKSSSATFPRILAKGDYQLAVGAWRIQINESSGVLAFSWGTTDTSLGIGSITPGTWNHVAVTRSSGTLRTFLNGTQINNAANSVDYSNAYAVTAGAGASVSATELFCGYISNVRIIKGTAIYTATFTPSTIPLSIVTNTTLLICNSNRFKDDSNNNFAITVNGDVKISNFAPHRPTAAYAIGTNGASAYFDGTGDFLSYASNAAFALPGAFTWETWFYPLRQMSSTFETMLTIVNTTSGLQISNDAGAARWGIAENGVAWRLTTTTYPILYAWNHIAIVRSGTGTNQTSIFLNGVRIANGTVSNSFAQGQLTIGANSSGTATVLGRLSDLRLVKGTAVYDPTLTTLTVPTSPLTAITNTQLLCNFNNATIIDSSRKNILETVGNAQISTTQSKFGTGALYFDGTGDYLQSADDVNLRFGTEDFTLEGWVYLLVGSTSLGIMSKGNTLATTGWTTRITTDTKLQFSYTNSSLTGATVLSTNTWYHFAIVRSGSATGNLKIYLNGQLDATSSTAVTDDFSQTDPFYVGLERTTNTPFNGYIDDVRVTKGIARYTANFTPPTAAFEDL